MLSDFLDEGSGQSLDMQSNYDVKVGDCLTSPSSSYRVKKILGSGAYGKVLLCEKASNNQIVALKVLTDLHDDDVGQKEARILQMLQDGDSGHDNVVRYVDSFQHEGHHCHEFEKLDIDMNEFLESRPHMTLPLAQIRPIIAQMARALQYLKTKGIVHCDLKPANIMMTDHIQKPLHIKLIDFGLACPVSEAKRGSLVQTFYYRAPEVQVGGAITEAIDIWSVGCIAVEMFLGTYLFAAIDQYDLMRHVVRIVGQPPKHILDTGKHTNVFFRRPKGASQWIYRKRLLRQPFPLTVASLDDIYENYPVNGETMTSPAENQDRRLFVDLLKHMLDVDPVSRYTPEDILNHPFITMSHLQHRFPLYYSKSQKIMDQVLDSSNEEDQPSTSSSTKQVSEAAEVAVATQSQTSSRKRRREEEEEIPQKRLKKEDDTSAKSQRGDDTSEERPKDLDTALQSTSRGETSFSQLRKEQAPPGKWRESDCEGHNPPLPTLRRSARIEARHCPYRVKNPHGKDAERRILKELDTALQSTSRGERPKELDTALQSTSRGERPKELDTALQSTSRGERPKELDTALQSTSRGERPKELDTALQSTSRGERPKELDTALQSTSRGERPKELDTALQSTSRGERPKDLDTALQSTSRGERPKDLDTALQSTSRGETSFSQLRKEQAPPGKWRESDCEGHNPPLPTLRRSARIQARHCPYRVKNPHGKDAERRILKELDTALQSTSRGERPKELDTALQSTSRGERPKELDTALQSTSRGETSFSQLRKEQAPPGKWRESDCEGHNPPLPTLRRSARIQARHCPYRVKNPHGKDAERRILKEEDASGKWGSGGYHAI